MLGMGMGEILVIAVIALLVVGPERLPKVLRQVGRWYGQLRRSADDLRRAFVLEADRQDASERYRQLQERRRQAQEARKKASEAAPEGEAAVAQPDAGPPDAGPGPADDAPAANDIPPDAPHPRQARAAGDEP